MKTENTEKIIRTKYLLELGVDFNENDLEIIAGSGDHILKTLSKTFRNNFSKLNVGKLVFVGHYNPETKTIRVHAEKEMFI